MEVDCGAEDRLLAEAELQPVVSRWWRGGMLFWSAFSTTGGLPSGQLRHQLHPAVGLVSTGECRGGRCRRQRR